jgi:DNA-binding response OmpR family regulator
MDKITSQKGTTPRHKILWVGDARPIEEATCEFLSQADIDVCFCTSQAAGLEALKRLTPEVVLLNWNTEGIDGRGMIKTMRSAFPLLNHVSFILLSDRPVTHQMLMTLSRSGFGWVLETPIALQTLPKVISEAIRAREPVSRWSRPARVIHFGCTLSQTEMPAIRGRTSKGAF